ncbi:MAG TPA: peptidoglycan-binding domain-containing protein [Acidimicrobiales bacterium]|jgi:hypothetical protein|nr:peptidoglycan-binding domain-containing protein [Acidimicrobiales bacterium]
MAAEPELQINAKGDAVKQLQGLLKAAGFDPGGIDGDFGPLTEGAVEKFQQAHGLTVDGVVGPQTWGALLSGSGHDGLREQIVAVALWGVAHEPDIHYEQRRPIDGTNQIDKLPLSTDCSGFATLCYNWAAAPDPNGRDYDGYGYTGTLLRGMEMISSAAAQAGDLVVIGPGNGEHVVIIVEPGPDPIVVSHGSEPGPKRQHLSVDQRQPQRFLRLPTHGLIGAPIPGLPPLPDDITTATNPPSE